MALKILVNGLLEEDSGKTWTIISLYNALEERGFKVGIYKPISGHNGWRQFDTIIESINRKLLICEDALKYLKHTDIKYPVELINPIDFLLIPTDLNAYGNISEYIASLENQYRQGVMLRISSFKEGFTNHYMIKENYNKVVPSLKPWLEKLVRLLDPIEIDIKQLFDILSTNYVDKILNNDLEELDKDNDIVLIESFNNISVPYRKIIKHIDRILTVTPGYIIKLNLDKAIELLNERFEEYLNSEKLLSDAGIESLIRIPPNTSIPSLSSYLSSNWNSYKEIIN